MKKERENAKAEKYVRIYLEKNEHNLRRIREKFKGYSRQIRRSLRDI